MYEFIIKDYVNKIRIEDIKIFSKKNDIILNDNEISIIYKTIKNDWKKIYNGEEDIFKYLQKNINGVSYKKIYDLYINFYQKYKK